MSSLDNPQGTAPLIHVPSTITFLNSSGTVDVFTTTGRVWIRRLTAFVTTNVVEDGAVASIELGGATDPNGLIDQVNPSLLLANLWWFDATPTGGLVAPAALQQDKLTDEDVILTIIGGTDLDSGVVEFNVWYYAASAGASLVAS